MLSLILSTLGTLVPIVLQNTGVIGANGAQLASTLSNLGISLFTSIKAGGSDVQDGLAALATLSGVLAVLKSNTGISADVLTQIDNLDKDVTAGLKGYALAGEGLDLTLYGPLPLVS